MASLRKARAVLFAVVVAGVLGAFSYACGPAGFDPQAKLGSVRVLSTRTDKPYAKPGDDVTVEMLAVDGRKTPKQPMKIYWLPFVCENPVGDLYYACFAPLLGDGGAGDGGGADAGTAIFRPGLDITPFLKEGTKYAFKIAPDIITRHKPVAGSVAPYGLAITFAVACAGHVRTVAIDPNNANPQKVPIGCFDDDGNALGADDFVFTFSRVYVYDKITNANPEIEQVLFDGKPVDLTQGVVVDRCTTADADCAKHPIDLKIPDSTWELDVGALGKDGTTLGEQVYGLYYYTVDRVEKEGRLLFDPSTGRVSDSANNFIAQSVPGNGRVYVVVHDNRGGVGWVDFPVYVK